MTVLVQASKQNARSGDLSGKIVAYRAADPVATTELMFKVWERGGVFSPVDPKIPDSPGATSSAVFDGSLGMGAQVLTGPAPPFGPGLIVRTSGSTGLPKGVYLTLDAITASAESTLKFYGIGGQDRFLVSLPMHHVGGLMIPWRARLAGAQCLIAAKPQGLSAAIIHHKPSIVSVVPTQLMDLIKEGSSLSQLARMKVILCGGAASSTLLWHEVNRLGLPVSFCYGMTETCSQIAATVPGTSSSFGSYALLGHAVVATAEGRIKVKSRSIADGYWQDDSLISCVDADGWFHSEDLGHLEQSSDRLVILGRADEIFKCGGEKISPSEILGSLAEEQLQIDNFAVAPLPHSRLQQVPVMVVWSEAIPAVDAIMTRLQEVLPRFKCPRAIFWARASQMPPMFKPTSRAALAAISEGARLVWGEVE